MIIVVLFSLLGDANTLYLMDKSFSFLPPEEEFRFIYSKNGFRTTQGCLDLDRWNQEYRTKIWIPLFSRLALEYNYYKEKDFDKNKEEHLFKFRWVPEEKDKIPLSFSLFTAPAYLKNEDYLGIGIGYWKNIKNNHFLNIIIHEFDHNFILSHKEQLIQKDPFTRVPVSIELKGKISTSSADLFYKYYKTIPGKQNFLEYNEKIGEGEYGGMGLTSIIYYHFFSKISGGIRLKYIKSDSSLTYLPEDSMDYETNGERLFSQPYIEIKPSSKNSFYIGFPIDWKYIKTDSSKYQRKWIGFTFFYERKLWGKLNLILGFQKSWRNLNRQKWTETRAVLGLEVNLGKRTYLSIREGIEMDFPLPERLHLYHNHTFILIRHSL